MVHYLGRGLWKSGDRLSFISSLSHSGDSGSPRPFCDYPPVLELVTRVNTLSTSHSSHIGSLTCGVRASMVGKIMWKPLELLLLRKIANQKQYWIPGGTAEISAITFPFNRPVWPMQKADRFWRMTVDYCKLNQVVTPIAAAVPDVVLLVEQINTSPGTWHAAINLTNIFSWYLLAKTTRSSLFSAGKASSTSSQSYIRAKPILHPVSWLVCKNLKKKLYLFIYLAVPGNVARIFHLFGPSHIAACGI